jgi:hypothetical protein
MEDVSGVQTVINIVASQTFPAGLVITNLADDADPLDFAAVEIADSSVGANGDLIVWAKASKIPMVISVIAGSIDDQNLEILYNANRVAQGKVVAGDVLSATVIYPDGSTRSPINGRCISYMPGKSIASGSFRFKTKTYTAVFEDYI